MRKLKKLLFLLTPMGAAAFVAGGGTFASFAELSRWMPRRRAEATASSFGTTKKILLASMMIGIAGYVGFGGTFANFQAETSNTGNSISSGTLVLDDTKSANVCSSYNADSHDNLRRDCAALLSLSNAAPGVVGSTATGQVTITNSGSIDGTSLYLWAPQPTGRVTTAVSGTPGTIYVSAGMAGIVSVGDTVSVSYGGKSAPFTVTAVNIPASPPSNGGATSLTVTGSTTYTFPVGSTVTDTSGDSLVKGNTDCFDSQYTSGLNGSTVAGSSLNFNPLASNPLCNTVLMYVQEITGSYSYCWFGLGSSQAHFDGTVGAVAGWGAQTERPGGKCVAPIYATTSGGSSGSGVTQLKFASALNGNVASGDTLSVVSGTTTATYTASSPATFGDTSISINSATVPAALASGATVTDTTQQTLLDTDAAQTTQYDTISAFDTGHYFNAGKLELSPLTGNGTIDTSVSHAAELAHGASRVFYVGVYLPKPNVNQNYLQGLVSSFGLTWHLDQ